MKDVNEYLLDIYDMLKNGHLPFLNRVNNNYFFSDNQTIELCYNCMLDSISVFQYIGEKKQWMLYLDKGNIDKEITNYDIYTFSCIYELIILMSFENNREVERLTNIIEESIEIEDYETASKVRDIIKNIKEYKND